MKKLLRLATLLVFKVVQLEEEITPWGETFWKIKLADGPIAYILWRPMGPDSSLGSGPHAHECLKADKDIVVIDVCPEPEQLWRL